MNLMRILVLIITVFFHYQGQASSLSSLFKDIVEGRLTAQQCEAHQDEIRQWLKKQANLKNKLNLESLDKENLIEFLYKIRLFSLENMEEIKISKEEQFADTVKYIKGADSDILFELLLQSRPFFLPNSVNLRGKKVAEIGSGFCVSVRAFEEADSVTIVEPDLEALAHAFDTNFTSLVDQLNRMYIDHDLSKVDESYKDYTKRLGLNIDWLRKIDNSQPWINDNIKIYLTKLEDLLSVEELKQSFDYLFLKDLNLASEHTEPFFKAASGLLKKDGSFIIQFFENEYNDYNKDDIKPIMDKYFGQVEIFTDERGSFEILNDDPLEFKQIPNHVRFVVLSDPTKSN